MLQKDLTAPTLSNDEDELFGQSVGESLKKMSEQEKSLAKMRIQQTLYEVRYCTTPWPIDTK